MPHLVKKKNNSFSLHYLILQESCINICCDPKYFKQAEELIEYDGVYGSWGIHPHCASSYNDEIEKEISSWMKHPKCVACNVALSISFLLIFFKGENVV